MGISQKHAVQYHSNELGENPVAESFVNDIAFDNIPMTLLIRRQLSEHLQSIPTERWTIGQSSLGFRISYILNHSRIIESTIIKLHWRVLQKEIWIDHLHLPHSKRRAGLGSRIVRELFIFAHELGLTSMVVMPLQSAVEFWWKNKFRPHPTKSKILQRILPVTNRIAHLAEGIDS